MRLDKLCINSINKTIASMNLNRFVKNLECNIGKKLLHDAIIMEGFVDITNGNTVIHGKNSVVDQGLIGIINWISAYGCANCGGSYGYLGSSNWGGMGTYMVIGSNTTQGTSNGTTALSSPIGTAPGTRPNTQSGINSNPASGQWQVQWTSTWNPGTIPATTLGEVGLYLNVNASLLAFGTGGFTTGSALFSRMSSADGKFTAFTINNLVPLSVAWTFRLTYVT